MLPAKLVREIPRHVLSHIMSAMLEIGIFSHELKIERVRPTYEGETKPD